MRLLVTRPEPDGERTAVELRALGHDVTLAPLLRVEAVAGADFGGGPWAAILITSANGARAIAVHPRRSELIGLPVLAVGQSSAAAARAAGFADVISADGDGGDLARVAAARLAGTAKPMLYLAGEERARDLGAELGESGLKVGTVAVYRTLRADALPENVQAALKAHALDGVLHFSRRSVESYLDCAREVLRPALAPIHFCLSARVAEPLQRAGAGRIRIAARPDEASLIASVMSPP